MRRFYLVIIPLILSIMVCSYVPVALAEHSIDAVEQAIEKDLEDSTVTRLEFTKLAVAFYNQFAAIHEQLPEQNLEEHPFLDTNDPFAVRAYNLGLMVGEGDGSFNPDANISIEEEVTVLYRVLLKFHPEEKPYLSTDGKDVAVWAQEAFDYMAQNNIEITKDHEDEATMADVDRMRGNLIRHHEKMEDEKEDDVPAPDDVAPAKEENTAPENDDSSGVQAGRGIYHQGFFTFNVINNQATITDYNGPGNVQIPDTLSGYPVTCIDERAFQHKGITSLAIPSSVTTIGDSAFYGNRLTSLDIPSSVTSIGNSAFYDNCLTTLTIPPSVESLGSYAFGYNQLTYVNISSGITTISGYTFLANNLSSVTIPDGVTSIKNGAFALNKLVYAYIPASVTSIRDEAFDTAADLTICGAPDSTAEAFAKSHNYAFETTNTTNMKTLTVNVEGRGDTKPTPGKHDFNENREVTLIANDQNDWIFEKWIIDEIEITDPETKISMDKDKTVTACFKQKVLYFNGAVSYPDGTPIPEGTILLVLDGKVVSSCSFQSGKYSLQKPEYADLIKAGSIRFVVNGVAAVPDKTFDRSTPAGEDTEINLKTYKATDERYFNYETRWGLEVFIHGYSDSGPKDVIIPHYIGGCPVTFIDGQHPAGWYDPGRSGAFQRKGITSVIIPDTITIIDTCAFAGNKLKSVTIPASVTVINQGAFSSNPNEDAFNEPSVFTVYGVPGSEAEVYAKSEGYTFKPIQ